MSEPFMSARRLLHGPWQAFERDVARLFVANGFKDVRVVGGPGDRGADILALHRGELWVAQCKHTTSSLPPESAVDEVITAGRYYGAHRLIVATSRPASDSLRERVTREARRGLAIELAEPERLLTWAENSPSVPAGAPELRPYQRHAVERLRNSLLDTGKGQVVMATGLGKTVVMAESITELLRDELIPGGRVLVLAHTVPLVDQLMQAFWRHLPKTTHTHRFADSERPTYWDGITFATIQSLVRHLDELPEFGLVVIDEAHHAGAVTFLNAIRALEPRMLAGVTATPWRGDGYDLDVLLGPPLVQIGISDGLQRGYLSEVDYRLLADNVDWELVQQASKHRYSVSQLNKKLILPTRDDEAAKIIARVYQQEERKSAIVYCPSGVHAKAFAAALRLHGLTAEALLHETDRRERVQLLSRFRGGNLHVIAVVDLFNEGVDVPDVDLLAFLRVTHSRRIFVQQLGRGLRISPNKKKVVVLDFVTDLRRVAEVLELDRAARGENVERLGLGGSLVSFTDQSAGSFLREWLLDQASLMLREGDPTLEFPQHDFPEPPGMAGIE